MKNYIKKIITITKKACKISTIIIKVMALDVRCFAEERRCKGELSDKLIRLYIKQAALCTLGEKICNETISICDEFKGGL